MHRQLVYALLVFVAGSSYGIIVPVVKAAANAGLYAPDFLPAIYTVAFVASLAVVLARRIPPRSPKRLAKLAALGVLTSLTSVCYYGAVALLPGAVALTLLFQYVWVGVVVECCVDRHVPQRSTLVAIAIVLVGTVLAAGVFESGFSQLDARGLALGAGSAVFYALFLFVSGRFATDEPVALRTCMVGLGGIVTTSLVNPAFYTEALFMPQGWVLAAVLAAIGVLVPVSLIAYASPHLSTGMVNIMASSELPVGVLAAWAFAGEAPSALTLVGVALVLAGIIYKQLAAQTQAAT